MRTEVFTSFQDLPRSVAERCAYPSQTDFFQSLQWFSCLFDYALARSVTPRIYVVFADSGTAVAALFCAAKASDRTLVSMTNFYSLSFGPIALTSDTNPVQALRALIEHLGAERPRWVTVELRYLLKDSVELAVLPRAFRQARFSSHCFFQHQNWYLLVEDQDFESYYASRSSRLRNTIERKEKKLNKAHDVKIRIHREDDANLAEAIEGYINIYNSSWKQPEPFPDFIPALVRSLAQLGILRLGLLQIDGEPAAAQLWVNTPRKAVIYKLAHTERFAGFSVGSILSREMFRYAIAVDGVREIDYGVGCEPYKQDWMTEVRSVNGLRAYNRCTASGTVLDLIEKAKAMVRHEGPPRG